MDHGLFVTRRKKFVESWALLIIKTTLYMFHCRDFNIPYIRSSFPPPDCPSGNHLPPSFFAMFSQRSTYAAVLKGHASHKTPYTTSGKYRSGQASLLDLPTELTSKICKQLGRGDVSSLRLANKYLAAVGAQGFPTVFCLDLTPRSIDKLDELCHDPQLALVRDSVKEVEIISSLICNPLPPLEAFQQDFSRMWQEDHQMPNIISFWIDRLANASTKPPVRMNIEQRNQVRRRIGTEFVELLFIAMERYSESATRDLSKIRQHLNSFKNLVAVSEVAYHQRPLSDCMNVPKPIRSFYDSSLTSWVDSCWEEDSRPVYSSLVLQIKAYFLWRHFYSQRRNAKIIMNDATYSPAQWLTESSVQGLPLKDLELSAPINAFTTALRPAFSSAQCLKLELLHERFPRNFQPKDLSHFWIHELTSAVNLESLYLWLPASGNVLIHNLLSGLKLPRLRSFTLHCERRQHNSAYDGRDQKAALELNFMRSLTNFLRNHSETLCEVDVTLRLPETATSRRLFSKTEFPKVCVFPTSTEVVALRQEISDRRTYSKLTRLRLSVQVGGSWPAEFSGLTSQASAALTASVDNEAKLTKLATALSLVDEIGRHCLLFHKHDYGAIAAIHDFGMVFPSPSRAPWQ